MPLADVLRTFVGAARRRSTSPLGVAIGVGFSTLIATLGISVETVVEWTGSEKAAAKHWLTIVEAAMLGGIVVLTLIVVALSVADAWFAHDPIPVPRDAKFDCRVLDSGADAVLINSELVARMFPDGSIDNEHALRAQDKNPCRLLGLIDRSTDTIAGWSSLWPVTVEAGRAIERGQRVDDDLKVDDLLPKHRNGDARYLILLSFGILPEYRNAPECPTRRLGRFVIGHIMSVFLRTTDRRLRLVAVAYSREGERMCKLLGLEPNGCRATYPTGTSKPIYTGDVTMAHLIALSSRI